MSDPVAPVEAALTMALKLFEHGSRRSGRTQAMIAQLKPGHRVVVPTNQHAHHLKSELREARVEHVTVVVASPSKRLRQSPALGQERAPTTVDHEWVRLRFEAAITRTAEEIRDELGHISGKHTGMPQWPAAWPIYQPPGGGWADISELTTPPAELEPTISKHPRKHCGADRDGECSALNCPQIQDGEPEKSGRHCPVDNWTNEA